MSLMNIIKKIGRTLNVRINPYTENENKYKYIYVHIPKTGGNGLCKSLFNVKSQSHRRLVDYFEYSPKKFREYYKFTVVRNPYDRFISAFYYLKSGGIGEMDVAVFKERLSEINNVDEFVDQLNNDSVLRFNTFNYIHFKTQSYFLEGTIKAKSLDHIGKQEDMIKTYNVVKGKLDIEGGEFVYVNKTPKYSKEISQESKDFIYEIYKDDFINFGYDK